MSLGTCLALWAALVKLVFTVTVVWDLGVLDIHHLWDGVSVLSSLSHLQACEQEGLGAGLSSGP